MFTQQIVVEGALFMFVNNIGISKIESNYPFNCYLRFNFRWDSEYWMLVNVRQYL